MSSFVIGLDIGGSHITSTLVRIEQSLNDNLSIERDIYYTRSFKNTKGINPRSIISTWIECINDVLHDFVNNYKEDDSIVGIACGIPGPMDYEGGICYIQSTRLDKCDQFFGLNLRLSMKYGLQDLIFHWKYKLYGRYYTPPTSPRTSISYPKTPTQQTRRVTFSSYTTACNSPSYNLTNGDIQESELSMKNSTDYCGLQENDDCFYDEDDMINTPRGSFIENTEIYSPRKSISTDNLSPKLWSIIDKLSEIPISFYNDATCFAVGEANNTYNKEYKRILALTLGTGFGSTFIDEGEIILNRPDVPQGGMLWNYPYDKNSIADDWFSTRGLINIYKKILQDKFLINKQQIDGYSLSQLASNGDKNAIKAFQTFANLLGRFLAPHIEKFHTDLVVIGGGIASAWYFIENELKQTLENLCKVEVYFSLSHEKSICLGAVQQQLSILFKPKDKIYRQTHQNLLPINKTINSNQYDLYPCHEIPIGYIGVGHKELNEKLFRLIEENDILLIDGFVGTFFDEFANQLNKYYHQQTKNKKLSSLVFYDTRTFLQIDSDHKRELYLKYSKSIFGKVANDLDFKKDFIDLNKFNYLQNNLSYPCVVIGPGASFINETSPVIYIDLTKNELYYRIAAQTACSYLKPKERIQEENPSKSNDNDDYQLTPAMYELKCLYFLDYPIFNKLKHELLPRINFFIDGQRPNCPTWIDGNTFRQALAYIANQPIRVRPWFEPGPWGGQWLKSVCTNISQSPKNYAWSFEMITPENGIILSDSNHRLVELSWDIFYGSQSNRILGNDTHSRLFGGSNDFPIRFDFLDTIDGGNLSIQCHPNLHYMRENFGEKITQDETYYIVETKQHWKEEYRNDEQSSAHVYLGFHDNVNPEEFHQALLSSRRNKQELDVKKYIQCIPSNIHDLFLIPNETIHASGQHQVVLEISATPYYYTFKLYDWLRLGLDGNVRPLNIEHGMKNLQFNRRGEQLRCKPISIKIEENEYEEQHLPTHDLHFYDIKRFIIEPDQSIQINQTTENRFHLCMLVEGDAIEIEFNSIDNTQQKQIRQYNYIETFLIPASIQQYYIRPIIKTKPRQFVLLIAFLKWDCEKLL